MSHRHWSWMIVLCACLLLAAGCAREAVENVEEAEQDLEEAWEAEKAAAVAAMKTSIETTEEKIDAMRARAAELEAEGEEAAAAAWNKMADRMETAREAAARELAALENAGKDAWEATEQGAAAAVAELEHLGDRASAFAAETRDDFLAGARAVVEQGEEDLAWAREKLATADEAAKEQWQQLVDDLETQQQKAVAELKKIEEAAEDAWADLAHGFVAAYHDLADASKKAMSEFGDV